MTFGLGVCYKNSDIISYCIYCMEIFVDYEIHRPCKVQFTKTILYLVLSLKTPHYYFHRLLKGDSLLKYSRATILTVRATVATSTCKQKMRCLVNINAILKNFDNASPRSNPLFHKP